MVSKMNRMCRMPLVAAALILVFVMIASATMSLAGGPPVEKIQAMAESGNVEAQMMMGKMFFMGQGVDKDIVQAQKWLILASQGGDPDAADIRDMVAAKMTPDQIAEAQKLAAEWKPKR